LSWFARWPNGPALELVLRPTVKGDCRTMQGDGVSEQSIKVYDRTDRDVALTGIRMAPGFSRSVRRIRKQLREGAKIGLDRCIEGGVGWFVHDRLCSPWPSQQRFPARRSRAELE